MSNNIEKLMVKKSNQTDIYYTIAKKERTEIKIKASKFIATVSYASTKEEAIEFLNQIKAEFHDASHNCFAYRIGATGMEYRFSDDGEPSGSAGKPILFALKKYDYSDIIVIVTRYFGGTKLGVGGLARAYSESAGEVLALCEKKPVYITIPVKIFCTYEDLPAIKKLIANYAINSEEIFHDAIEIKADIQKSKIEEFKGLVTSVTRGRAGVVKEL
jgi:uncharacterized YigZ family protein